MAKNESDSQDITQSTKKVVIKTIKNTLKPLFIIIAIIFISLIIAVASIRLIFHNDSSDKVFDNERTQWQDFDNDRKDNYGDDDEKDEMMEAIVPYAANSIISKFVNINNLSMRQ